MDRFSLCGFPRPHLPLHFCEIIAESFIFYVQNVLCILFFYNLPFSPRSHDLRAHLPIAGA